MPKLLLASVVSLGLACGARHGIVNDSSGSMVADGCDRDRNNCAGGDTLAGDDVMMVSLVGVVVLVGLIGRLRNR